MSQDTILIIGAGGKTGARVNARLKARGIATRAVSRSTGGTIYVSARRRERRFDGAHLVAHRVQNKEKSHD